MKFYGVKGTELQNECGKGSLFWVNSSVQLQCSTGLISFLKWAHSVPYSLPWLVTCFYKSVLSTVRWRKGGSMLLLELMVQYSQWLYSLCQMFCFHRCWMKRICVSLWNWVISKFADQTVALIFACTQYLLGQNHIVLDFFLCKETVSIFTLLKSDKYWQNVLVLKTKLNVSCDSSLTYLMITIPLP